MSYAVIQFQGKQFTINEGDTIVVDHAQSKDKVTVTEVLLASDGKKVTVGDPFIAKATVELKVVSQAQSDKIRVSTFKAKARQRKVYGHRQPTTTYQVSKINV